MINASRMEVSLFDVEAMDPVLILSGREPPYGELNSPLHHETETLRHFVS